MSSPTSHDPYQALRYRDFRLLLIGSTTASLGMHMLNLAVGWDLYERTGSALALGMVGLVQVIPIFALFPITGHIADSYDRKSVVLRSQLILVLASLGLAALSHWQGSLLPVYGCLLLLGIGTAFNNPAARVLPAEVLPDEAFENSATWSSSTGELSSVIGPASAGIIITVTQSPALVYSLNGLAALLFLVLLLFVRSRPRSTQSPNGTKDVSVLQSLGEGIGFLRRTPIILGSITLDLFAVLFGGATALLPVVAKDILQVGPTGLGWLRAAPSIGAVLMALHLAHRPPLQRTGSTLLLAVAGFGMATIVFGLSTSFWLSLAMLFLLGAMDNISMVIRRTLTLTRTPNEMRGRVAAINGLFISASNQLGGFESGLTAQLFGPVLSIVGGGMATILVVIASARIWPELRRLATMRESGSEAGAA